MINRYTLSDPSNATGEQKKIFDNASKQFNGRVPNIINAFSESPVLAQAMLDLYAKIGDTGFTPSQAHVVMQTVNILNDCRYCVPAHSTGARAGGVDVSLDESLRNSKSLEDSKLKALRQFTILVVESRARVSAEEFDTFIGAGWTRKNALEVIFLVTIKTLTNYANHLTGTDLDEAFKPLQWTPTSPSLV